MHNEIVGKEKQLSELYKVQCTYLFEAYILISERTIMR